MTDKDSEYRELRMRLGAPMWKVEAVDIQEVARLALAAIESLLAHKALAPLCEKHACCAWKEGK